MTFAALRYYAQSVVTLLAGVRNLPAVAWALFAPARGAGAAVTVRLKGGYVFRVQSALDVMVLKEVILDREYQRMGPDVAPGWTVVDIGAAYGEFAIPAARRIGTGRVIAVEPAPETLVLLRANLAGNDATRVEVHELAIGARDGTATLSLARRGAVMNSTAADAGGGAQVAVPMATLASLFERAGIARCDYLKMDCEGGEYDILLPASDATLRRIERLCIEYHDGIVDHAHGELVRRLEAAGFAVHARRHPAAARQGWLYAERITTGVPPA